MVTKKKKEKNPKTTQLQEEHGKIIKSKIAKRKPVKKVVGKKKVKD